ncbi:MAG: hypothetical protein MUP85_22225, partial [Candidatus Lokiarchaeota archaeon]|nr:hypothetical protein [Candidatus Lokiarchaeota archaeon]
ERHKSKRTYDISPQAVKTFISKYWTLEYCLSLSGLKKLFYKSVLLALQEQKISQQIRSIDKYQKAVEEINTYFNSWTKNDGEIALAIYLQILGEQKVLNLCKEPISKPIVAQQFAKQLEEDTSITKENLENDVHLKYLLDAIKYAARAN